MPIFKLEKYPYVCRLCLNPEQPTKMTSLETEDECLEGGTTFENFLAKITFQVEEEKRHLFPRSICPQCKESLQKFASFRTKVRHVHLFMNALVELRDFNTAPVEDLFFTKPDTIRTMLAELDVCHKTDSRAEDLIDEFPQFQIAQLPATLKDDNFNEELKMEVEVDLEEVEEMDEHEAEDVFAEEELVEPTKEIVPGDVASEDVLQQCSKPENGLDAVQARKKYSKKKEKKQLQCPKCPYTTTRKTHYNAHQRMHLKRENRSLACTEPGCTEKYANRRALQKHMVQANHIACVCETCGYQCSSNGQLKEHTNRFHTSNRFKCEYCERTFKVRLDLQDHVKRIHLSESVYKCETCGTELRTKTALKNHQATHSDVYNFPCQQCDKKYKVRTLLQTHVLTVHKEASLECEHCFRMFYARWMLLNHIESVHKIQMRFVCDVCVASFDSQENLAAHKARHENPKHFQCGLCLIVFPGQEQLADHMCITYREDYVCCERDLRYHVHYNRHMFLKHGVKINARVKPDPHLLVGQIRAKRKQVISCSKCKVILSTRTKKKQHQETCTAGEL